MSGSGPTSPLGGIAGIGISLYLLPTLSLGADLSLVIDTRGSGELNAGLGLTYHFLEKGKKAPTQPVQTPGTGKPQPLQAAGSQGGTPPAAATQGQATESGKDLAIKDVSIAAIFPIFHTFYDDHPIGKLTVANTGSTPITDVTSGSTWMLPRSARACRS